MDLNNSAQEMRGSHLCELNLKYDFIEKVGRVYLGVEIEGDTKHC